MVRPRKQRSRLTYGNEGQEANFWSKIRWRVWRRRRTGRACGRRRGVHDRDGRCRSVSPPMKRESAEWLAGMLVASVGLVWCLWVVPYIPTHDGPQHILSAHIENHYSNPGRSILTSTRCSRNSRQATPARSRRRSPLLGDLDQCDRAGARRGSCAQRNHSSERAAGRRVVGCRRAFQFNGPPSIFAIAFIGSRLPPRRGPARSRSRGAGGSRPTRTSGRAC